MRVLYGYRWDRDHAAVDPAAAAVVAAVLAYELGKGETVARCVLRLTGQPLPAVRQLVQRIRSHRHAYLEGRAHATLPPDRRLKLSGVAPLAHYCAAATSCVVPGFPYASPPVARPGERRLQTTAPAKARRHVRTTKNKTARTDPSPKRRQARR